MQLSDDNLEMYAATYYIHRTCQSLDEFREDLRRFANIRKLIYRYYYKDDLNERLILNHLTIIFNVFQFQAGVNLLFHTLPEEYFPVAKTFLIYMGLVDSTFMTDVPLDGDVVDFLRKL